MLDRYFFFTHRFHRNPHEHTRYEEEQLRTSSHLLKERGRQSIKLSKQHKLEAEDDSLKNDLYRELIFNAIEHKVALLHQHIQQPSSLSEADFFNLLTELLKQIVKDLADLAKRLNYGASGYYKVLRKEENNDEENSKLKAVANSNLEEKEIDYQAWFNALLAGTEQEFYKKNNLFEYYEGNVTNSQKDPVVANQLPQRGTLLVGIEQKNLKALLSSCLKKFTTDYEKLEKGEGYNRGFFPEGRTRLVLTQYMQTEIEVTNKKTGQLKKYSIEKFISIFGELLTPDFYKKYKVRAIYGALPPAINQLIIKNPLFDEAKNICIGQVEMQLNNKWIPLTSYLTVQTKDVPFSAEPDIPVYIMPAPLASINAVLPELAMLLKIALEWKEEQPLEQFSNTIAQMQYLLSQAGIFFLGTQEGNQIFINALNQYHGFELLVTKENVNEDLNARCSPWLSRYLTKYSQQFSEDTFLKKIPQDLRLYQALEQTSELSKNSCRLG